MFQDAEIAYDDVFEVVFRCLKEHPRIRIGKRFMAPWFDEYPCLLDGERFSLVYDLDYGVDILADKLMILEKLQKYFDMFPSLEELIQQSNSK